MNNIFENLYSDKKPLAERMRPKSMDDFVGQQHILGKDKLLRRLIEVNRVPSVIFYGSPGTGKTTLARIIADSSNSYFVKMNAINSGVADAKAAIDQAKKSFEMYGKKTYLLLDECHRWSKAQSDSLLAALEDGHISLIGSTTENPSYAMTRAIVSRCSIFEFKSVDKEDIKKILLCAIKNDEALKNLNPRIDDDAADFLASASGGDVRSSLNALEIACLTTKSKDRIVHITKEVVSECLQQKALSLDEGLFYDITSAFCKSLRGSDSTAALYYANRLIEAGVESEYLARRCIAHASEDCHFLSGALQIACNALFAIQNLGMPEGNLALSQAIIYICEAPKDNSVYLAMHTAKNDAKNNPDDNIPPYLRVAENSFITIENGEARSRKSFQNFPCGANGSTEYKYPHDYLGAIVEQQYLPNSLKDRVYFKRKDEKE